jgi:hypothetical protein
VSTQIEYARGCRYAVWGTNRGSGLSPVGVPPRSAWVPDRAAAGSGPAGQRHSGPEPGNLRPPGSLRLCYGRGPPARGGVDQDAHTLRLLDTKSGQPQTRGYHPDADDALSRWLDTRKALGIGRRWLEPGGAGRGGRLFCTPGGPVSDDYVREMLRRLAALAGACSGCTGMACGTRSPPSWSAPGTPVTTISRCWGTAR